MLDPTALAVLRAERVDWRFKSIPSRACGLTLAEWLQRRPTLSDMETPLLTLDAEALEHNIHAMARWCRNVGLSHAPHGKTTMAPALWQRQLAAGAWAITLANVAQLRVARAFEVPRVLVANELVTPSALRWLTEWMTEGTDVICFVDSLQTVSAMDEALSQGQVSIPVCVELGGAGGRAGARDLDAALNVASAVRSARRLRLVGVGGYEGSLAHDDSQQSLATVDDYLVRLEELHSQLSYETDRPMVTVGGSMYYDQVAERLGHLDETGARVVLRAGSYITSDDGMYQRMDPVARGGIGPVLRPALRGYATVVSKPEKDLALLDAGRRDLPFDAGMPVPLDFPEAHISKLNDQHAYLHGASQSVEVGDVVRLGISHPCTAFDKWPLIPVLDAEGTIVDAIRTYF